MWAVSSHGFAVFHNAYARIQNVRYRTFATTLLYVGGGVMCAVIKSRRLLAKLCVCRKQQVDLLEAVPINKWTETQQDGYRLRRQRITELSAELKDADLSFAA
jgi:hypothetical protein